MECSKDDLISRQAVYTMLNELGGCGASDDWAKGWDEAINSAVNGVNSIRVAYDPEQVAKRIEKCGTKMSTVKMPHVYMRAIGTRKAAEIVRTGGRRKTDEKAEL